MNFRPGDDRGSMPETYRRNLDRPSHVKRSYDRDNLFRLNQNVAHAATPVHV